MIKCRLQIRLSALFVVLIWCASAQAEILPSIGPSAYTFDEMASEDAATLLKSHEMFGTTQTITLNTVTIHAKLSDVEHYQPKYTVFKSMGLIELTSIKVESPDKDASKSIEGTRVSLTERGVAESKEWKQTRENEWSITIATRELVAVIKIHKDGQEQIHGIEFSWTWTPNKIGEALKFSYPTERAYAKVNREQTGWRIVSIRAL